MGKDCLAEIDRSLGKSTPFSAALELRQSAEYPVLLPLIIISILQYELQVLEPDSMRLEMQSNQCMLLAAMQWACFCLGLSCVKALLELLIAPSGDESSLGEASALAGSLTL